MHPGAKPTELDEFLNRSRGSLLTSAENLRLELGIFNLIQSGDAQERIEGWENAGIQKAWQRGASFTGDVGEGSLVCLAMGKAPAINPTP
jgi:hypothetical protein